MNKIGIFFGTDTGNTGLIANKIAKSLGDDIASTPQNINKTNLDNLMQYDALILGTPSYGDGLFPGYSTGIEDGSWEEFIPQLCNANLIGKKIALYGLGNQEEYPECFADALFFLYVLFNHCGARIVGDWSTDNYNFIQSKAVVDGRFVGLVLDHHNQEFLTDLRLDAWLAKVKPMLLY